ncbi:hypothetical protein Bca52824_021076 [Brassica carinata]|uniref:Uncharacterized protein n=1 Tax=Brassica carinata TaxID=52824 RepID=A0A8X7VU62_BRACI|nr:hypothetical protein Bca52824_021076 [Brassica carinata]
MSTTSNPNSSYGTGKQYCFVFNQYLGLYVGYLIELSLSSYEWKLEAKLEADERIERGFRDKNHLFKWTDESAVEEIDDMKILYDEKIGHLELQSQRCEDGVRSFEKKIEDLGDALAGFEKEMKEMKELVHGYEKNVKSLKKMVVCGVGMMIVYYYFAM